jgi:hypothetical protein
MSDLAELLTGNPGIPGVVQVVVIHLSAEESLALGPESRIEAAGTAAAATTTTAAASASASTTSTSARNALGVPVTGATVSLDLCWSRLNGLLGVLACRSRCTSRGAAPALAAAYEEKSEWRALNGNETALDGSLLAHVTTYIVPRGGIGPRLPQGRWQEGMQGCA